MAATVKRDVYSGKVKPKSDVGIFLGYSTKSKAYRCLNKRTGKIVESINVKIDEYSKPKETINNDKSDSHQEHDAENPLDFNEMITADEEEEQIIKPLEQGNLLENIRPTQDDEQEIVHDHAGDISQSEELDPEHRPVLPRYVTYHSTDNIMLTYLSCHS